MQVPEKKIRILNFATKQGASLEVLEFVLSVMEVKHGKVWSESRVLAASAMPRQSRSRQLGR